MSNKAAISEYWPRIGGFSVLESGEMGLVWLSIDPEWDVLRIHHAAALKRAPIGQIASEINRHKWIPVAWADKDFAQELEEEYGCNMLPDPSPDSRPRAEELTNVMLERMETGRFRIGPGAKAFADEQKTFNRANGKGAVPRDSHPLMAATRHAIGMLQWARPEAAHLAATQPQKNYPKLAIV